MRCHPLGKGLARTALVVALLSTHFGGVDRSQLRAESVTDTSALMEQLYERCGNDGGSPGAISLCFAEYDKNYGRILQQTYDRIIRRYPHISKFLRASQRSWLAFQKDDCDLAAELIRHEGSNFDLLSKSRCILQGTLDRIKTLERMEKGLIDSGL